MHPTTLAMSSGFFGFFAHLGVVTALEEIEYRPQKVVGSSAGALIGALWASGMAPSEIKTLLFGLRRQDFWDPGWGSGFLKGEKFRGLLQTHLPVARVEDCRFPLSLSVYDKVQKETFVVSEGPLAEAIYASCAVPFLFQPVRVQGRWGLDGGVLDRHGMLGAAQGERIFYHHLKSRSPWRKKNSPALQVPERANMQALVLDGLPRLGPFKLELGPEAFEKGYRGAAEALDCDIKGVTTEVTV
tara:strand:+ start:334 stop:1062 length:729 start_codon:yes stop_codon:yes gene_type:complete